MRSHRETALLVAGLVLAVFLRAAYLIDLQDYEFLNELHLDPASYDRQADGILRGEGPAPGLPYYQAPLYPYFLAAIYAATGKSFAVVRLIQLAIGVATVFLIGGIARRLFGRAAGVVALFMAALYGPFPFYEAQIMKTALGVFLAVSGTWLLLRRSPGRLIAAGIVFGLAALVRENLILLVVAGALHVIWNEGRSAGWKGALLLIAGGVITITPVALRNYAVSGEWHLVTSQGGQNFYIGNNPEASGYYTHLPFVRPDPDHEQADFRAEARRRTGRDMTAAELSRYWYGEAIGWMKSEPAAAASLLGRKFLLFWNDREIPDNENFYYHLDRFPALRWSFLRFGWIAPFAIFGIVAGVRRIRTLSILHAAVAVGVVSLTAFFLFSRYRLGSVPFLIVFAAHGLCLIFEQFNRKRYAQIGVAAVAIAAFAWLSNGIDPSGFDPKEDGYLPLHVNRGMLFEARGEPDHAAEEYRAALEIAPENGVVWRKLGRLHVRAGRDAEAAHALGNARKFLPEDATVRDDLARLCLKNGDFGGARSLLREALRIDPQLESARRTLDGLLQEARP